MTALKGSFELAMFFFNLSGMLLFEKKKKATKKKPISPLTLLWSHVNTGVDKRHFPSYQCLYWLSLL